MPGRVSEELTVMWSREAFSMLIDTESVLVGVGGFEPPTSWSLLGAILNLSRSVPMVKLAFSKPLASLDNPPLPA